MSETDGVLAGPPGYDEEAAIAAVRALLVALGEDPEREGLKQTPRRVARAYREAFSGLGQDQAVDGSTLQQNCRTGADANDSVECAVVAEIDSIQDYWGQVLGARYQPADTVFFPERDGRGAEARRICGLCTVRDICLAEALAEEAGTARSDRYGYRGGLGPTQRAQLDREAAA